MFSVKNKIEARYIYPVLILMLFKSSLVVASDICPKQNAGGEDVVAYEGRLALAGCSLADVKRFKCYPKLYAKSDIPIGSDRKTRVIMLEYDNSAKHQYIMPVFRDKESASVLICGNVIDINGSPRFSILAMKEIEGN